MRSAVDADIASQVFVGADMSKEEAKLAFEKRVARRNRPTNESSSRPGPAQHQHIVVHERSTHQLSEWIRFPTTAENKSGSSQSAGQTQGVATSLSVDSASFVPANSNSTPPHSSTTDPTAAPIVPSAANPIEAANSNVQNEASSINVSVNVNDGQ